MRNGERELRLKVMGISDEAEDRAVLIVDNRGALKQLEADLTAIDPR